MSNAYQLIWFRQDLRVRDHAALWHACQQGNSIALVILSPDQWKQHDDAPIKISFYLRQLKKLQDELVALHIPLVIQVIPYWKDIAKFISDFSKKYNIENVYANIE
ncbi:deoxyribodipyrimidine photo-lyase, partial [Acinetobacter seifertii]